VATGSEKEMAFAEHPDFQPPPTVDATIWRYMDLAKFLSLLDRSELFFVRADKLAEIDPFEGYYTNANLEFENLPFEETPKEWRARTNISDEGTFKSVVENMKIIRRVVKEQRELTFISSWHALEYESAAMWSLYVKTQEGIAIQSTYERFISSLAAYQDFDIYAGMIRYIDYKREVISMVNIFFPFMHKRKSFEHENELRALIWTPQHGRNEIGNPSQNKYLNVTGLYVKVDLGRLISCIYVTPTAAAWTLDLLRSVVKKYGLEVEVIHSDLALAPVY